MTELIAIPPERKDNVFTKIWQYYISSGTQRRLKIVLYAVIKWYIGLFLGVFIGFILCYIFKSWIDKTVIDWKIITGIIGSTGAIITAFFIILEKMLRLMVEEKNLELLERQHAQAHTDIQLVSDKLVQELAPDLRKRLFHYDTIYEMRAKHYAEEKQCIAEQYVKLLENRVNAIKNIYAKTNENIKEIIIIMDSGTTIAQIFEVLGKDSYKDDRHWTKRSDIFIYTNSIRGVLCLFKYRDQASRYSEIPFRCNMFPGKILSPYEAIADIETVESILRLKKDGRYVIFITTGNYLIFNSNNRIIFPIARAGYHAHVKAAGYTIANEVHLVAPLGKILLNSANCNNGIESIDETLARFNKALGYSDQPETESEKSYSLIDPNLLNGSGIKDILSKRSRSLLKHIERKDWTSKSLLVTTHRMPQDKVYWLSKHSSIITQSLRNDYSESQTKMPSLDDKPYIKAYGFGGLPISTSLQVEYEVPHKNLRARRILGEFFQVEPRS